MDIVIVEAKWFNTIFVNVHAPTDEKIQEKDEIYDGTESISWRE